MGKKRSSGEVATEPTRPSKKRKSAVAGMAKIKEMTTAEAVAEAEEVLEMKVKAAIEVRDDEEDVDEVRPVVAPGFRVWNTTSKMTAGGELSNGSMLDLRTLKYSMMLDIQSDEAFTLRPLIVTQGPYKGARVFMLESGIKFRFFDFPAEIRNLVYSFLVEEEGPIKMSSHKVPNEPRRPVKSSYWDPTNHRGLKKCNATGKWLDQPPSNLTVLCASRKVYEEVAPILYGSNSFQFCNLADLRVFLDRTGSVRKYLRHIEVTGRFYSRAQALAVFHLLKNAISLRSLSFTGFNDYYLHVMKHQIPLQLASCASPMIRALRRRHQDLDDDVDALDIVKISWRRCHNCEKLAPELAGGAQCMGFQVRKVPIVNCAVAEERCGLLHQTMQKELMSRLKIKEVKTESFA